MLFVTFASYSVPAIVGSTIRAAQLYLTSATVILKNVLASLENYFFPLLRTFERAVYVKYERLFFNCALFVYVSEQNEYFKNGSSVCNVNCTTIILSGVR